MIRRILQASRSGFISDTSRYRIIKYVEAFHSCGPQPVKHRCAWNKLRAFCNIEANFKDYMLVGISIKPLSLLQSIAYDIICVDNETDLKRILLDNIPLYELSSSDVLLQLNERGIHMLDGALLACTQVQRDNVMQYRDQLPTDIQEDFATNFNAAICINNTIDEIRQATLNMLELTGHDSLLVHILPYVAWWSINASKMAPIEGLPSWLLESL